MRKHGHFVNHATEPMIARNHCSKGAMSAGRIKPDKKNRLYNDMFTRENDER